MAVGQAPPPRTDWLLQGNGQDTVGQFTLEGEYKSAKVAFAKKYILGTGDAEQNEGHTVQLRLTNCHIAKSLPEKAQELFSWGMPPEVIGFYGTRA